MSDLKSQLQILVALQKAENEIRHTEKALNGIDERVNALNREMLEYQKRVADQEDLLAGLKKQYRDDENEVRIIESQIIKSKEKLGAVKTNKEYQSMLKEIDELEDKLSHLEDQVIKNLDQIELSEKNLAEKKADLVDVTSDVQQSQEDIRDKGEKQRRELALLRQKRDDIWNRMEAKTQNVYKNIKRQGNGIAMAEVVDCVCQECRMNIPPQLFHELLRMDNMRMCPHCQRIMYPKKVFEEA